MSKYQMKQLEEAAKLMAESAVQMQEIRKRLFSTVQQLPSILGVKLESEESPEEVISVINQYSSNRYCDKPRLLTRGLYYRGVE